MTVSNRIEKQCSANNKTPMAQADVSKIGFGTQFTPDMLSASYANDKWAEFAVRPLPYFELHPAAIVLHYSQSIFEGWKVYRQRSGGIALFRPEMNVKRLNRSAARMENGLKLFADTGQGSQMNSAELRKEGTCEKV